MLENIEVLYHSCVKISKEKIIYIDPFKIDKEYNDADIIFITHDHYDHYSEEDIEKIRKNDTIVVAPKKLEDKLLKEKFEKDNIVSVIPNKTYKVSGIEIETVAAYNVGKTFHPKENEWVGYIININEIRYYIAGDTDENEDNKKVKCDIAFVPVGGKYTMDCKEAAEFINKIKPKIAIPIHYGSIVGSKNDAIEFVRLLDSNIKGIIMM